MKRLIIMFALFAALAPAVTLAASLTNPIWDGRYAVTCNVGNAPCTFCDLLKVSANIVDALTLLIIPIAAAIIVYGGFRIMTAGSSPAGLSAGKEAMKWAGIGIAVALSGWLIVNTVFSLLSGGTLTAIECPTGEIITPVPYDPYQEPGFVAPSGTYSETITPISGVLPIAPSEVRRFNSSVHQGPGSGHGWASCGNPLCAVDLNVGVTADDAYTRARAGIPIYSPFDGTVRSIGSLTGGTGMCMRIENVQQNNLAVLCHINANTSLLRQQVRAGQQVGTLTAFRGDFGPHLHFELMVQGVWIIGRSGLGDVWINQQRALSH